MHKSTNENLRIRKENRPIKIKFEYRKNKLGKKELKSINVSQSLRKSTNSKEKIVFIRPTRQEIDFINLESDWKWIAAKQKQIDLEVLKNF